MRRDYHKLSYDHNNIIYTLGLIQMCIHNIMGTFMNIFASNIWVLLL